MHLTNCMKSSFGPQLWTADRKMKNFWRMNNIDNNIDNTVEYRAWSRRNMQNAKNVRTFQIQFANSVGRYDLEVTTFQMAVLFCWNDRPKDQISYENLRLATQLPDNELRRTLWSLVAFPKLRHQVMCCDCESKNPKDFTDSTLFWPNDEFALMYVFFTILPSPPSPLLFRHQTSYLSLIQ